MLTEKGETHINKKEERRESVSIAMNKTEKQAIENYARQLLDESGKYSLSEAARKLMFAGLQTMQKK